MADIKCQGFHNCPCVNGAYRVTRADLRVPSNPQATEVLCSACLRQLQADLSFFVIRIEQLR